MTRTLPGWPDNPDDQPDEPHGSPDDVDDGNVVDLDAARLRAGRAPIPQPDTDDADDLNGLDGAEDLDDYETVDDRPPEAGRPVDPDDEVPAAAFRPTRNPIIPAWAAGRAQLRATARHARRTAGYTLAYHGIRLPKYVVKLVFYAGRGLIGGVGRAVYWARAEEGNWALRQHAASRNEADSWLKLDNRRARSSVWRWWVFTAALIAILVTALVVAAPTTPDPVRWLAITVAVLLAARLGRPADRKIFDRVSEGRVYRKLTAELVRRALASLGLAGINSALAKDPGAITFPTEIHRDGPGHLAIVDLPYGVEAVEVIARRGRLASGLRLPLDQVWPSAAPGHTGRLALWVGHEPASQMRQPAWPLLSGHQLDLFKAFPFATDPRLNPVNVDMAFRNWLFGGQPGSGKTFALRLLLLAASLDPRCEIRGYELKGVGDFAVLAPVMAEYGNGFDDDTLTSAMAFIEWLYEECRRRSKRIEHYARTGKAPENKVTPELAKLPGSGLHLLVAWFDELQELMTSKHGKAAGELLEKVIKLGRALGVIIVIGTQIPDKDSLPTGITRNVNSRFCLSVADQTANDMILGTSAYKLGNRATVFQPVAEAGWGILAGFGKPAPLRSFYVNTDAAARMVAHAVALRTKAGTLPDTEDRPRAAGVGYDLLADLLAVWPGDVERAANADLIPALTTLRPDVYDGWKPEQLTAALKPHGITVGPLGKRDGTGRTDNRRGPAHADIHTVVTERHRRSAGD